MAGVKQQEREPAATAEAESQQEAAASSQAEESGEEQEQEPQGDAEDGESDEPNESSADEEDGDESHEAVGFGDAMSKILGQNVAEDAQPILAKRTTARMREIQNEKNEIKRAHLSAAERREREQKDMLIPDHTTAVQDRKLRLIATKGVVALFNAIEKHQHQSGKKEDKNDKKVKEMSKDNFLGLLKASQKATASTKSSSTTPAPAAKSSWSVVQDDFMMGAKLKDWDAKHGTELGRVRQEDDADTEAVEDVAWKQAGEMLGSDDEAKAAANVSNKRRAAGARVRSSKKSKRS